MNPDGCTRESINDEPVKHKKRFPQIPGHRDVLIMYSQRSLAKKGPNMRRCLHAQGSVSLVTSESSCISRGPVKKCVEYTEALGPGGFRGQVKRASSVSLGRTALAALQVDRNMD